MKCIKCSAEIPDNAFFCQFCGSNQEGENDIETQIENVENKLEITGCRFSKKGRINCREWIREFGYEEVCLAVDIALKQYLEFDEDDHPISSSVNEVYKKIPGICYNRKQAKEKPYMADTQKMINYASQKFRLSKNQECELKDYIQHVLRLYSKKDNYADNYEELFWEMKRSDDEWEFWDILKEIIREMEE